MLRLHVVRYHLGMQLDNEGENMNESETQTQTKPAMTFGPLLYGSRVKDLVKDIAPDFRVGSDALDVLEAQVKKLVSDAVVRAQGNKRKTLQGHDF